MHPGVPPEGMEIPFSPERIAEGKARFGHLAEMLRNDPAVALRYQSKDPELPRRQARKIRRVMRLPQAAEKVTVRGTVAALGGQKTGDLNSK